ncbi:hypothetical protein AUJ46_00310 [Candidatus Peregrinibacteria bacterium CG1_02_54_53]|nr:MAG: hypothetical protein AUJ46_00310 [Candidatus Peregrinibacteria bacterium CG1_02_54_53]
MHKSTSHIPETPQQPSFPPQAQNSLHVQRGISNTRDRAAPFLSLAADVAKESEREKQQRNPNRATETSVRKPVEPARVLPVESLVSREMPLAEVSEQEPAIQGATAAALGTAAAASVLPAYGSAIVAPTARAAAAGFLPSAGTLGLTLGIPAAGGAVGYYLGKKLKHPVAGSLAGAAAGAATTMALTPYLGLSAAANAVGASSSGLGIMGAMQGAGVLTGLATGAALPLAGGATLYGLGRWHQRVRGSAPAGLVGTMARGIIAPVSVPLGYLAKMKTRRTQ